MIKPCVLMVDDEQLVRDVVRRSLERHGFRVLSAQNGEEAVALYETHVDSVNAVLIDYELPDIDGIETYVRLRQINPAVRAVLATGYGKIDTRPRLGRQLDCISKPFEMRQLVAKLHE